MDDASQYNSYLGILMLVACPFDLHPLNECTSWYTLTSHITSNPLYYFFQSPWGSISIYVNLITSYPLILLPEPTRIHLNIRWPHHTKPMRIHFNIHWPHTWTCTRNTHCTRSKKIKKKKKNQVVLVWQQEVPRNYRILLLQHKHPQ